VILFIGDSLAVGTPLAGVVHERVVKRAEGGIGTAEGVRRFVHPLRGARVLVVSLGSNDRRARTVGREASRVKALTRRHHVCLLWVQVSAVPAAARINRELRRRGIELVPWHSRVLHPGPAGYRLRARRIARMIGEQCVWRA
jgi:lysophospholipase L1-like esterase